MDYCRLYATFRDDPKVLGLSDRAFRHYVESMCWTTLHETDGVLPRQSSKAVTELVNAGLWDPIDDGGFQVHGWLGRQRSKADLDAKRIAGRNAAGSRWRKAKGNAERNAEPNTEVEVERDSDKSAKGNTGAALAAALLDNDSRAQHFLRTLVGEDPGWMAVTNGALMKLGQTYDADVVTTALGFMREEFPTAIGSPYAYLESVCVRIQTERGAA